ncbi:NAD-dependent succinate-semialdehyde dehydrogenase [Komagataeibacter rhaeticus]|uniref:NAD-dependent succinate-semialdehyde dehydrogenase n=1 Tax=Komagataeibacter rhaeticus TaxID=215221 RepID=A0A181CA96_9PROT|nr:NAD-dependent succinate-semialdehyde dehydrogenase [Komagataeibacter rhaeticus]ATU72987.1 NAD-dependent succinate-semialdehyde dehydrogenase [Komagataeibacter xylinus]QIP35269.1 NAD-dependent succinate-semialdehyde dehydrogenase [Komagataeibacter rhaeticus]QOC47833.1 NAD-dependent succinate-semialdehyde dehydrogenase [Komagataeibacter rhaeticus]WPP22800.1 NAD-dependent succinate-semialdehyde dehydrogenase [Komagataeibacter rhaeticus]SAY48475.1 Glutarate-semialdehyde dehydrogenase DavD [Koma
MYTHYGLFIGDTWRPAADGRTEPVISPVSETSLGDVPCAGSADTEAAIAAAREGLACWRATPAWERATALHAIADEMTRRAEEAARIISAETGKPIAQARREWGLSIDQFRWYAEEARRIYGRIVESRAPGGRFEVSHEPVGVVAAFTAWNFPASLLARKIAPALAAGCSLIARPSSQTPGSAMIMVDCCRAGNLPAGVVNLVVGPTEATYGPIMESTIVRKVSLTGSTRIGQQMIRDAAATMKKVSMELGGNAPLIIYDDADLDLALNTAAQAKFGNTGQVCVAPDRFFIHDRVHDAFVEGFVSRAKALTLGDGLDPDVGMGPLINARRLAEMEAVVADAVAGGASIRTGGQRPSGFNNGYFFEPTVLTEVTDTMRVMAEENFGPIAAITRFSDEEEVLTRANASDMGLAAYAFTRSPARARRTVAALKAGMVGINSFALAAAEAPFGGTNFSGMGREGGSEGILDYLDVKLAQVVF